KDLESMKAQGIAEATIINVGLIENKTYLVPQVKFGTDAWYQMFKWALKEAKRLGITIGVHNCDGWSSSGGPWITPERSMKMFTWANTNIEGGKTVSMQLERPFGIDHFYKDVAVVAFPSSTVINSFQKIKPAILLNDSTDATVLADGNPVSTVKIDRGNNITFQFSTEFGADKICLLPRKEFTWSSPKDFEMSYVLSSSSNGKDFQQLLEFEVKGLNQMKQIEIPATKSRYYKLVIKDFGYTDSWLALTLAEVELLKKDESPSYDPGIKFHQEKTVMVKAGDKNSFEDIGLAGGAVDQSKVLDISNKMDANGMLHWNAPAGNWKIIRFGYTTTGAMNAPATKEGEGFECDKMDSNVVGFHFSQFPQKLIDKAGAMTGNTFKFLLIDSWECAFQNWTQSFPHEFEARRGYKITPFIPALCGEMVTDAPTTEAFLFDFRTTIANLIENNYYKKFNSLCHKNKLEMHAEIIYGGPGYPPLDVLKTNQYADMPMFEFWTGHNSKTTTVEYNASKNAAPEFLASATLFNNKKILGSEAYTGSAHYSESPAELKPYGDRAYCSGINQMILHSYVHQPTDSVAGMTLGGFASHFNRNNSWFNFA
ncbi:MAG: glycosyl hydrolase, partial [Bacteroidota bacterium]